MIAEPDINKTQLQKILNEEYGFFIEEIIFNPKGEASWSYILQTDKGRFFLKLYQTNDFNSIFFEFTFNLYSECQIENIVHPLKTKSDYTYLTFEEHKIVVFNFIDGKTIREQLPTDKQYEELGEILARVHKSHETIGPVRVKEDFEVPFKKNILKVYENIDSLDDWNEPREKAKLLYIQYKSIFLSELENLENKAQILKDNNTELVNCHGEPSPGNVMISSEDIIYLIDWDFPIYAPKEKDLMFFDDNLELVLKGYRKIYSHAEINNDAKEYYGILWNVQEIADWGTRLLLETHSQQEDKHHLNELINFLDYSGLSKKLIGSKSH